MWDFKQLQLAVVEYFVEQAGFSFELSGEILQTG